MIEEKDNLRIYVIAGEASGDLHGSNLIEELKNLYPGITFRGYGGDLMIKQGVDVIKHIKDIDYMGFWEVLINLRKILNMISDCKKDIINWHADAIILIDYPGFNLRIAEFAKKNKIPVYYYISPQLWAWKQRRINKIKRNVKRMFVILPFEKKFYARFNYKVDFVGHPLLDAMKTLSETSSKEFINKNGLKAKEIIALLPGSRKQEIKRILPIMIKTIKNFNDQYQFVIAGAPSVSHEVYKKIVDDTDVITVYDQTYDLLINSKAALITSGTATLEAALLNVPQVVCYKANCISYFIAEKLVHLNYISLVNLILERETVKELIQNSLTEETLTEELKKLIYDEKKREQIHKDYVELKRKLGGKGASKKTAELILKDLQN